ncbi:MAG: 3-keto-5-aminohexanoate cleavage protein, partial [Pseudomonadota bacterium]
NLGKNPNIPITPEDIARDVALVAEAGAAMVHIHARDPATSLESWEKDHFLQIVDHIRDRNTDIIINLTSAIGMLVAFDIANPSQLDSERTDFWSPARRLEHIELCKPDVCSLDLPIMNYADTVYANLPEHVVHIARRAREIGVKPEIECFTPGDLWRLQEFLKDDLFAAPPLVQLCMGVKYGMPATPRGLVSMCDMLPSGVVWSAFGIGGGQMPMVAQSILMGGHVRVGLEDNLYLDRGVPATNLQLVQRAVEIIERLGASVMSTAEARAELNLE